jgi:hypothetical protein
VAIAFGMVIALIASLDRPSAFVKVTQQLPTDVKRSCLHGSEPERCWISAGPA